MENRLIEKMKGLTLILVIVIIVFSIVNTVVLLHKIVELENKIEYIKTFKTK